jgi:hypothetical protein
MKRKLSKKKSTKITTRMSRKLHRQQKPQLNKGPIIVLGVGGFIAFTLLVIGGIVIFVLRPAYDALMDFVNALGDSDYSFDFDDYDDDEDDDDEEEDE